MEDFVTREDDIVVSDNLGYSLSTQAVFVSDSKPVTNPTEPTAFNSYPWSPWGDGNDEPQLIAADIEACPVLSAGVEAEARLATGKDIDAYLLVDKDKEGNETLEWVGDAEVNDWLDANNIYENSYQNIYNMLGYGMGATQFVLNGRRDYINRIRATDIATARLEMKDPNGYINNMFLCRDWSMVANYDPSKMKKIMLLQDGYEWEELDRLKDSGTGEFAILHRLLRNGRGYYPKPMHRSAKAWVDITKSIPAIKNAIFKNQMTIKYVVTISDTYYKRIHKKWDSYGPEERKKIIEDKRAEINKFLAGSLNAGKSIIAGKYFDPQSDSLVNDIEITVLDDKWKEGKLLPDTAAADKQILFSMMFNPAIWGGNLLGDGASGGAGSGSDIREATLVLMMLLHPERTNNLRIYNLVKNFNGWKRLEQERIVFPVTAIGTTAKIDVQKKITPRLVFRYSSSVLTTLDTGKSTKPTTN